MIDRVLDEGADLGIAWDGDADRCFFIDDNGEFVDGDFLTALLAGLVLAQAARGRRSSTTCAPAARSRTRSRPPAAPLTSTGSATRSSSRRCASASAAFGGEVSGHYYFREFWCADSGTLPALFVLELLGVEGRPLSELVGAFRDRYFISGEINSEVADQEAKMREIAEAHADAEISWLDGVSVDYPDWHFNVRPSNTEPLLRLNLESLVSREDMEAKRDRVLELIRS